MANFAKNINEITKEMWLKNTFPEWGTWLNEEIAAAEVPEKTLSMWWLGNMGIWIKSDHGTNVVIDMWNQTGKKTIGSGQMKKGHQMMRMSGVRNLQPNRRNQPFVIDPFEVKDIDVLCVTHSHSDHLDQTTAAVVTKNCPNAIFVGPQDVADKWISWGVPEDRIVVLHPHESVKVKDVEVIGLESFDRTMLLTVDDPEESLKGKPVRDMNELALNYLVKTEGGSVYHAGDSHYSNMYVKHGKEYDVDIACVAYGENPIGITDKLTSSDVLKVGEALQAKVVIPTHYDIWTNFMADPKEILYLWKYRKDRMNYKFQPFVWQVGGRYDYPGDTDHFEYMYDRGFHDAFDYENDLPYDAFL